MKEATVLVYDGSFNGFLTSVFTAFEERINVADIQRNGQGQNLLFSESQTIFTQMDKAKRVWNGLQNKSQRVVKDIYFAYLSEGKGIELLLYRYVCKIFASESAMGSDYSDDIVLRTNQLSKMVAREKHRMEAFVRFQLTRDGVYFANIEPDFNVLPLISKHFRSRYADQEWIIYDVKRKYGLFYDRESIEIISLDLTEIYTNSIRKNDTFSVGEHSYQELWSNYFRSTNIKSRINRKLHRQHVPKRYWKYLSEKKAG
jgi:probable DNA metabolism protein